MMVYYRCIFKNGRIYAPPLTIPREKGVGGLPKTGFIFTVEITLVAENI